MPPDGGPVDPERGTGQYIRAGYARYMLPLDESSLQAVEQRRRFVRQRGNPPRWQRGRIGPAGALLTRALPGADPAAGRQAGSQLLHQLGDFTAHAAAGLLAAAAVLAWVVVGVVLGFPNWWDNVLYIVSSSVTLVMVFAIQHTQARQQSATQRKLDELLRALPAADSRLIAVEEAPDAELEALAELNLADRDQA